MIKLLEEKQVPRAKTTCSNCGSLFEYSNADLSACSYKAYKHYLVCPVCGCDVNATWIVRSIS